MVPACAAAGGAPEDETSGADLEISRTEPRNRLGKIRSANRRTLVCFFTNPPLEGLPSAN